MSTQLRLLMSYGQDTGNYTAKPELGKEYTVDITDTSRDGEGVTKIGSLIIFVKNGKAGVKNVKIKINSVRDNFATAEIAAGSTDTI